MRKEFAFTVKYEEEQKENGLSSFGGIPIFLEFLFGIGFDDLVSYFFKARSQQGWHPLHHILTIILMNLTGGESVCDVERLEEDCGLRRIFSKMESKIAALRGRVFRKGRERTFPSESRIFGFLEQFHSEQEEEERVSKISGQSKILPLAASFRSLSEVNRGVIGIAQQLSPQKRATLDMDNNLIACQKATAEWGYKKFKAYHPFNVYWKEQDLMLYSEFRDGNVPAGKEQLRVLREAEKQLPKGVEEVRLRSDSAGYQHDLMEYCESGKSRFGKIPFAISCDVNTAFRQAVMALPETAWKKLIRIDPDGNRYETGQEVAEVCYVPQSRNKSKKAPVFRYLALREKTNIQMEFTDNGQMDFMVSQEIEQKLHLEAKNGSVYKIFGIVTNRWSESPSKIVWWHRKRCGRSEQEHSRLTKDLAGGRFPSQGFGENAAWWYLAILSLNLLKLFQMHTLPPELKRVRKKKLDGLLFRVAVKVVKRSRDWVVKFGKGVEIRKLVPLAQERILKIHHQLKRSKFWLFEKTLLA